MIQFYKLFKQSTKVIDQVQLGLMKTIKARNLHETVGVSSNSLGTGLAMTADTIRAGSNGLGIELTCRADTIGASSNMGGSELTWRADTLGADSKSLSE